MDKEIQKKLSDLSNQLKDLRLDHQYTQRDLGDILNMSPQAISSYENGKVVPGIDVLIAYAEHFGLSVEYFFPYKKEEVQEYERLSSSEVKMIKAFRQKPTWLKKVIRELCYNGENISDNDKNISE